MDKLSLLKFVFIFGNLEESILKQLLGQMIEVTVSAGDEIFAENAQADSFFIIESGETTITKKLGKDREKALAVLGSGSVFGEMAFFSDSPRTAGAKAKTGQVLWKIERKAFMSFISENPQAGIKVLLALLQVSMDRLEQTSRELATVYQTGKILSSCDSLKKITSNLIDEIILAVPVTEKANIFLFNEFNQEYDALLDPENCGELGLDHPVIPLLKTNANGLLLNSLSESGLSDRMFLKDAKSILLAPILKSEALQGFIVLWSTFHSDVFRNRHLVLISSVAGQLSETIENIRYRQDARDKQRLNDTKNNY